MEGTERTEKVLSNADEIEKRALEIWALLEDYFARIPVAMKVQGEVTPPSNILDEVIKHQIVSKGLLGDIASLIRNEVVDRIV